MSGPQAILRRADIAGLHAFLGWADASGDVTALAPSTLRAICDAWRKVSNTLNLPTDSPVAGIDTEKLLERDTDVRDLKPSARYGYLSRLRRGLCLYQAFLAGDSDWAQPEPDTDPGDSDPPRTRCARRVRAHTQGRETLAGSLSPRAMGKRQLPAAATPPGLHPPPMWHDTRRDRHVRLLQDRSPARDVDRQPDRSTFNPTSPSAGRRSRIGYSSRYGSDARGSWT